MSEGKNNTVMLTIIGIATLLIAVVGATFAYFSATLTGTDSEKEYTVRSATVGTQFNGGADITATGIYPKAEAWGTKTFSIKTTSTKGVSTKYRISLVIDDNDTTADATISDGAGHVKRFQANALSYTLTATEDKAATEGTMPTATETKIADPSQDIVFGTATIYGNDAQEVTQTYTLSMFFKNTNEDQNANQGAQFKAHISISEITPKN